MKPMSFPRRFLMFTILFDLDGTLLPMDYDTFEKGYFDLLVKKLAPQGFSADETVGGLGDRRRQYNHARAALTCKIVRGIH